MDGEARLRALDWADHEEVVGELAKDMAAITHRILTMQSDLEAALKREDTLVVNVVRWLKMAEGNPKWQHLDDTVLLAQMADEIEQALEPYRVKEQAQRGTELRDPRRAPVSRGAPMKVAWVRHRGAPQAVACLLNLSTWKTMCGMDWNGPIQRFHWTYYEPVAVPEPASISATTGRPEDNACLRCIERSWLLAVRGELEITTLLDSQTPPSMEVGL